MSLDTYQCWRCGQAHVVDEEPVARVFCDECKVFHEEEHRNAVVVHTALKTKIMCETALRTMEKAGAYMHEYQRSADQVLTAAQQNPEAFKSSYEVIVAIILDEFGYEYSSNHRVGRNIVDFYIPELKTCVEVDGFLHDGKEIDDSRRDITVRKELGPDWEIVRLPTKYIEIRPERIPEAIETLANEKRKLRKKNGGIIPEHFSKRERRHYGVVGEYVTIRTRKK